MEAAQAVERYMYILHGFLLLLSYGHGSVEIIMDSSQCGGNTQSVKDDFGFVQTANYPDFYTANCHWKVVVALPSGGLANVYFGGFTLGAGDSLTLTDVQTNFNKTWTTNSNSPAADNFQLSSGFSVTFTSDNTSENIGVKLMWNAISTVQSTLLPLDTMKRDVVADSVAYIQSPGYPGNYPSNDNSHWVLTAPENERIVLEFEYLKTESRHDFLRIYSGRDILSEELMGEYSGNYMPADRPPPLISTTNRVHLVLTSDQWLNFQGFSIKYSLYKPATVTTLQPAPNKLDPAVTAVIIVLLVLFVLGVVLVLVYFFWYRPKKRMEETIRASEMYKNEAYTADDESVKFASADARPGTASNRPGTAGNRPGTARIKQLSADQPASAIRSRPMTAGRPPSAAGNRPLAAVRPGTAMRMTEPSGNLLPRIEAHANHPNSGSERPDSGSKRPDSGSNRSASANSNGFAIKQDGSDSPRKGSHTKTDLLAVPENRPLSANRNMNLADGAVVEEKEPESRVKRPTSALVGSQRSHIAALPEPGYIKRAPPMIAITSGILEEPNDLQLLGDTSFDQEEKKGYARVAPVGRLPPISGKLPPLQYGRPASLVADALPARAASPNPLKQTSILPNSLDWSSGSEEDC